MVQPHSIRDTDTAKSERLGLSTLEDISKLILQSSGLDQTLRNIVRLVADRMQSEVCSIYLCENDRLVLRATLGLASDSTGRISLGFNEGLIGYTAETRSIVNVGEPQSHPRFHYIADSNEEIYHSFLGIPLQDRQRLIGVMAIQTIEPRQFGPIEISTLTTIAFQLSAVVASARLLDQLDHEPFRNNDSPSTDVAIVPVGTDGQVVAERVEPTDSLLLKGELGFGGVAMGPAYLIDEDLGVSEIGDDEPFDLGTEQERLSEAIEKAKIETLCLEKRVAQRLSEEDAAIFHSHLMILQDRVLLEKLRADIHDGRSAASAIKHVIGDYVRAFRRLDDPYLQERAADMEDIGRRLLSNLSGQVRDIIQLPYEAIVVAKEMLPSDIALLDHARILGLVLEASDSNGHAVIIAKSLGIPTLVGVADATRRIRPGNNLILDSASGALHIEPAKQIRSEYRRLKIDGLRHQEELEQFKTRDAVTVNGTKVTLRANIGLLSDVSIAQQFGAEGVGLYRTELPYMARASFPDRKTQYEIYRRVVEGFPSQSVTVRTLDIGGDKSLPYFDTPRELNPFLGWRSVRVSLDHRDMFRTQIEAILMAATHGNVKLMFPMVTTLDEVLACKMVVAEAKQNLMNEGWTIPDVPLGVMIEVPGAIAMATHFAKEVDFFALGTNDLIQYLLAADRGNSSVSHYYDSLHPAVLAAIAQTVATAKRCGKNLCICGEMASDPASFALLVGLGLREFSVSSPSIFALKALLSKLDIKTLQNVAEQAMAESSGARVRKLISEAFGQVPAKD
ncbi:phosphoenolpyruvate--protein phosphotransferase [Rubripirellula reticaptiva]|uniref:phosphoenolpyruvate--protein phosphotransferase n=1 Tax=Rubripirellula reticaptiva TaxID=2528013 RepID=A0A5C6FAI3_9BACT|nr:phosphoenolpyruvate--protein phosphotransferase [Rubripirellula reticaptiva]TWU57812.1 Phosphoenolpyruvate-protein phosphotransferase [Rubripirellula reticaptiva]